MRVLGAPNPNDCKGMLVRKWGSSDKDRIGGQSTELILGLRVENEEAWKITGAGTTAN